MNCWVCETSDTAPRASNRAATQAAANQPMGTPENKKHPNQKSQRNCCGNPAGTKYLANASQSWPSLVKTKPNDRQTAQTRAQPTPSRLPENPAIHGNLKAGFAHRYNATISGDSCLKISSLIRLKLDT